VPACSSTGYVPPPPRRGDDAVEVLGADADWTDARTSLGVIGPDELPDWLAARGFELDPATAAALQPHLDAGEPMLTIQPDRPVAVGAWLPPVRFRVAPGDLDLPVALGVAPEHALELVGVAGPEVPNPSILNFPRAYPQRDCLIPNGEDGDTWLAESRAALAVDAPLAVWVLEHAGTADVCDPCTEDAIDPLVLGGFGFDLDPSSTRLSRIWLGGAAIDEDPRLSFAVGDPNDTAYVLIASNPELGFAFPVCGHDAPAADAQVCDQIHPPDGAGCATAPAVVPLGLVVAVLALRRRGASRVLALGLVWLAVLPATARAAPRRSDPRTEVAAAWAVVGTDRIVPTGLSNGAPWLANPYLGVEVRRSVFSWRDARNVGILGGVRGMVGKAAPWSARGVVGFGLVEPTIGLDARHGRFREASPCWFGRYGLDLTATALIPSVSPPRVTVSAGVHAGFGAWLGRGTTRTAVELRGGLLPRTDGFETAFHPNVGIPGWMYFPGTANVWLVVGRAAY
ncbi:MAG: hypothetical protein ABMB14_03485, partial [Myxococcota bacterium]